MPCLLTLLKKLAGGKVSTNFVLFLLIDMKKILLLSLFMVFPLAAKIALYDEEIDEFTDIKEFSLFIYADDQYRL